MLIGVVVIGRNEGERLGNCLRSVMGSGRTVVYVDSGSTDGSLALAESMGAVVVQLDLNIPFTAARARNEGFSQLRSTCPGAGYVQFIDGDCEIVAGWLDRAAAELDAHPDYAVVCGRRRERFLDRSVYNRLCDMEWNTKVGGAKACGGDALMRVMAFEAAGGYNVDMAAGEEPELCVRLRSAGWKIRRIDAEMTIHDAAMTRFGQWWKRSARAGHAYAEGAWLHRRSAERYNIREVRSILAWGLILPLAVFAAAWSTRGFSLLLLSAYALLWLRVRKHRLDRADPPRLASLYATFCVIAKFAQALGVTQYAWRRLLLRRPAKLIEYKDAGSATAAQSGQGTCANGEPQAPH